jgi:hypothetical protein
MPDRLLYATLSHCWGHTRQLKSETSNLNDFRVQVPESKLCKTFKDAIAIVKYLGLGYLWIDSLCIVQDDLGDWRRESAKMSSIYSCLVSTSPPQAPEMELLDASLIEMER